MSANYSFVGEVNRNNAMGAVADTMNELNLDILKATMEMGGKQVVEKDGKAYALERLDNSEVKDLKDKVTATNSGKYTVGEETNCTKGANGQFYTSANPGVPIPAVTVGSTVFTFNTTSGKYEAPVTINTVSPAVLPASATPERIDYSVTEITNTDTAAAIFDILGIDPSSDISDKLAGNNWKITMTTDGDSVTMKVAYVDANTGDTMAMAVRLKDNGECTGLSELSNKANSSLDEAIVSDAEIIDVDGGGLLKSWGISNPEELQPGDLFLVQQKLQIIKDTVSAVHTTGKTQGDIMREATQKFAQG